MLLPSAVAMLAWCALVLSAAVRCASAAADGQVGIDVAATSDCRCWAVQGQCHANARFMQSKCQASCTWYSRCENSTQEISVLSARVTEFQTELKGLRADLDTSREGERMATAHSEALQTRVAELEFNLSQKESEDSMAATHRASVAEAAQRKLEVELEEALAAGRATATQSQALEDAEAKRLECTNALASALGDGYVATNKSEALEEQLANLRDRLEKQEAAAEATQRELKAEIDNALAVGSAADGVGQALKAQSAACIHEQEENDPASMATTHACPRVVELEAELAQTAAETALARKAAHDAFNKSQILQSRIDELEAQIVSESAIERKEHAEDMRTAESQITSTPTEKTAVLEAANPCSAELEAKVRQLRRVVNSSAAAELAFADERNALELRVQELESQLRAKLATEQGHRSADSDPWVQLHEACLNLPSNAWNWIVKAPVRFQPWITVSFAGLTNATLDAIRHILDDANLPGGAWSLVAAFEHRAQEAVALGSRSKVQFLSFCAIAREAAQKRQVFSPDVGTKTAVSCLSLFTLLCCLCLCKAFLAKSKLHGIDAPNDCTTAGADSTPDQLGVAEGGQCFDAGAAKRQRRRELQEERTLQALKLSPKLRPNSSTTSPLAPFGGVSSDADAGSDLLEAAAMPPPQVSLRSNKRPPPLMDLDDDGDTEAVEATEAAASTEQNEPVQFHAAAPRRCSAAVSCIALLSCIVVLGLLFCALQTEMRAQQGREALALLTGRIREYWLHFVKIAAGSAVQIRTAVYVCIEQALEMWKSQTEAAAINGSTLLTMFARASFLDRVSAVLPHIHGHPSISMSFGLAFLAAAVVAFVGVPCARQLRRRRIVMEAAEVRAQAMVIEGALQKEVPETNIPATTSSAPAATSDRDTSPGPTTPATTDSSGDGGWEEDDTIVKRRVLEIESKIRKRSQGEDVAEECPVFDMAAEDEHDELVTAEAAPNTSTGYVTYIKRFAFLLAAACLICTPILVSVDARGHSLLARSSEALLSLQSNALHSFAMFERSAHHVCIRFSHHFWTVAKAAGLESHVAQIVMFLQANAGSSNTTIAMLCFVGIVFGLYLLKWLRQLLCWSPRVAVAAVMLFVGLASSKDAFSQGRLPEVFTGLPGQVHSWLTSLLLSMHDAADSAARSDWQRLFESGARAAVAEVEAIMHVVSGAGLQVWSMVVAVGAAPYWRHLQHFLGAARGKTSGEFVMSCIGIATAVCLVKLLWRCSRRVQHRCGLDNEGASRSCGSDAGDSFRHQGIEGATRNAADAWDHTSIGQEFADMVVNSPVGAAVAASLSVSQSMLTAGHLTV